MSRIFGLIVSLGLVAATSASSAWAISPLGGELPDTQPALSLIIQVKPMTEKQKCKALNRCRAKYTYCYNKLVAQHKNIETKKITCVKPYQKCINASFGGFDFFFQRWFTPEVDCSQY